MYGRSFIFGLAIAALAMFAPVDAQAAPHAAPSDACTVLAARYNVDAMSDHEADWTMNRVGCDERRSGGWSSANGTCNREARRLAYLGMDPNAEHFYYYVNEGVDRDGECTLFEDGSWSDPR